MRSAHKSGAGALTRSNQTSNTPDAAHLKTKIRRERPSHEGNGNRPGNRRVLDFVKTRESAYGTMRVLDSERLKGRNPADSRPRSPSVGLTPDDRPASERPRMHVPDPEQTSVAGIAAGRRFALTWKTPPCESLPTIARNPGVDRKGEVLRSSSGRSPEKA